MRNKFWTVSCYPLFVISSSKPIGKNSSFSCHIYDFFFWIDEEVLMRGIIHVMIKTLNFS